MIIRRVIFVLLGIMGSISFASANQIFRISPPGGIQVTRHSPQLPEPKKQGLRKSDFIATAIQACKDYKEVPNAQLVWYQANKAQGMIDVWCAQPNTLEDPLNFSKKTSFKDFLNLANKNLLPSDLWLTLMQNLSDQAKITRNIPDQIRLILFLNQNPEKLAGDLKKYLLLDLNAIYREIQRTSKLIEILGESLAYNYLEFLTSKLNSYEPSPEQICFALNQVEKLAQRHEYLRDRSGISQSQRELVQKALRSGNKEVFLQLADLYKSTVPKRRSLLPDTIPEFLKTDPSVIEISRYWNGLYRETNHQRIEIPNDPATQILQEGLLRHPTAQTFATFSLLSLEFMAQNFDSPLRKQMTTQEQIDWKDQIVRKFREGYSHSSSVTQSMNRLNEEEKQRAQEAYQKERQLYDLEQKKIAHQKAQILSNLLEQIDQSQDFQSLIQLQFKEPQHFFAWDEQKRLTSVFVSRAFVVRPDLGLGELEQIFDKVRPFYKSQETTEILNQKIRTLIKVQALENPNELTTTILNLIRRHHEDFTGETFRDLLNHVPLLELSTEQFISLYNFNSVEFFRQIPTDKLERYHPNAVKSYLGSKNAQDKYEASFLYAIEKRLEKEKEENKPIFSLKLLAELINSKIETYREEKFLFGTLSYENRQKINPYDVLPYFAWVRSQELPYEELVSFVQMTRTALCLLTDWNVPKELIGWAPSELARLGTNIDRYKKILDCFPYSYWNFDKNNFGDYFRSGFRSFVKSKKEILQWVRPHCHRNTNLYSLQKKWIEKKLGKWLQQSDPEITNAEFLAELAQYYTPMELSILDQVQTEFWENIPN